MANIIRAGIRPSILALKQADEVRRFLPQVEIKTVTIETRGDKDKVSLLSHKEDSDFFTREIEEALLAGSIDAGIHSAKDIESNMPEGLVVAAMSASLNPFECLVSRGNLSLEELPRGASVGTSSRKRKEALERFRYDFKIKDIRGNIDERLKQLDDGKFDAIIVASAALLRLGNEWRIAQIVPKHIIEPHPLQGRIAVQVRKDRDDLVEIFRSINAH